MKPVSSRSIVLAPCFRAVGKCLLVPVMVAFAATTLTSCKTKDKDAPPKRLKHNYRDAVEQRVFYDGWFER